MMTIEKKSKKAKLPAGVEVEKTTKAFSRAERRVYLNGEEIGYVCRERTAGWVAYLKDSFIKDDTRWCGQEIYHEAPLDILDGGKGFKEQADAVARLVEAHGWDLGARMRYERMRERQKSVQQVRWIRKHLDDANRYARASYERITDNNVKTMDLTRAMDKLREAQELVERAVSEFDAK